MMDKGGINSGATRTDSQQIKRRATSGLSPHKSSTFSPRPTQPHAEPFSIPRRDLGSYAPEAGTYIKAILGERFAIENIPMQILQKEEFIQLALKNFPKKLVAFLNSLPQSKFTEFIDSFDALPEAICGKLFAYGLNPKLLPDDIKYSSPFLRVAIRENPGKVAEFLNGTSVLQARLATKSLPADHINDLLKGKMHVSRLSQRYSRQPRRLALGPEHVRELEYPINNGLKTKLALQERKATQQKAKSAAK